MTLKPLMAIIHLVLPQQPPRLQGGNPGCYIIQGGTLVLYKRQKLFLPFESKITLCLLCDEADATCVCCLAPQTQTASAAQNIRQGLVAL